MEKEYFFNNGIPPPLDFQPSLSQLQMPNNLRNLNSEKSMEQYSQFGSTLSSIVPSPPASNPATEIRELIGKLGTICNAGDISPEFLPGTTYNSSPNTSCYNTPMDSPIMNHFVRENLPNLGNPMPMNSALPTLSTDPGFAERAAKFSCFGSRSFNSRTNQIGIKKKNNAEFQYRSTGLLVGNRTLSRVSSSPSLKIAGSPMGNQENKNYVQPQMEIRSGNGQFSNLSASAVNSNEESPVSEQIPCGENGLKIPSELNSRKRKGVQRGKGKETTKDLEGDDDSNVKKSKMTNGSGNEKGGVKKEKEAKLAAEEDQKQANSNQKPPEPPKDYIHVRARRGQATDSHSLAERVRREKISERMKLLQDLVPGCNKVTGKALMLDEIINYVQSLQRQVEFLSMKLATVNPRLDINMDSLVSKDIFQPNGSLPHQIYPVESSASAYYGYQGHQNQEVHKYVEPLDATMCRNLAMHRDGFGEGLPQFPAFSEDDLQSIVQMGFGPNQTSHMKLEL